MPASPRHDCEPVGLAHRIALPRHAGASLRSAARNSALACVVVSNLHCSVYVQAPERAGLGVPCTVPPLRKIALPPPNDRFRRLLCTPRNPTRSIERAIAAAPSSLPLPAPTRSTHPTVVAAPQLARVQTGRPSHPHPSSPTWLELAPGQSVRRGPRQARAAKRTFTASFMRPFLVVQPGVLSMPSAAWIHAVRRSKQRVVSRTPHTRQLRPSRAGRMPVPPTQPPLPSSPRPKPRADTKCKQRITPQKQDSAQPDTLVKQLPSMSLMARRALLGAIQPANDRPRNADCDVPLDAALDEPPTPPTRTQPAMLPAQLQPETRCSPCLGPSMSSLDLADEQVQRLSTLEDERQLALRALAPQSTCTRGLRGVFPACAPAALQAALSQAALGLMHPPDTPKRRARPCDIAARCWSPCKALQLQLGDTAGALARSRAGSGGPDAPWTQLQPRGVHLEPPLCSGLGAPCTAITKDGRDALGRCVDKLAYKRVYGLWPGFEAMLTFEEYRREVSVAAPVGKRARRPPAPPPPQPAICEARAASELRALGVRGGMIQTDSSPQPCTAAKLRNNAHAPPASALLSGSQSSTHGVLLHSGSQRDARILSFTAPSSPKAICSMLAREGSSQMSSGSPPADRTHSSTSWQLRAWGPDVRELDDSCRCATHVFAVM